MKIKSHLLLLIVIIISITACKKETTNPTSSIPIGDNSDIMAYSGEVNLKLTTLGYPMNSFAIDMDHNGFDDLKFVVENHDNINSKNQRINIVPINESVFVSVKIVEELYCKHINSTGDTIWYDIYDSTQTYDSIVYIRKTNDFHQRMYSKGDRIDISDDSHNKEMQIAYLFQQYNSSENYDYKYNEWFGQKDKYIGVKIVSNNATYLGWVKVEVIDYDKIYIGNYYLKQIK